MTLDLLRGVDAVTLFVVLLPIAFALAVLLNHSVFVITHRKGDRHA